MPTPNQRSFHLFKLAGVDVYLNWSWFLVALFEVEARKGNYSSIIWNVLEYVALFLIVLTHEFGHAMACRSVGGTVNHIMLWPFGGVAYVNPPQRPGATLWSLAAGPLVNVALTPLLYAAVVLSGHLGWGATFPDLDKFLTAVLETNIALLLFNILPIYPLDGGQILRSLLWYPMGRAKSLMTATILGFLGLAGFLWLVVWARSLWLGAMAIYLGMQCWNGFQYARTLLKLEKLPRHSSFACPSCKLAPLIGAYWQCAQCHDSFDTFATRAVCPNCGTQSPLTTCIDCRAQSPIAAWATTAPAPPQLVSSSFEARP